MAHFIAIAGNMGVGKSTLTELLAARLGWKAYLEPAVNNPYLFDFYQDMNRWGFHSQVFFLAHRLQQHAELARSEESVIQDRSVYENAEIFAQNLFDQGYLSERDWATFQTMYQTTIELLPPPNLIIYLQASIPSLVDRIQNRGHDYEKNIDLAYLTKLNQLHNRWATQFKRAPILAVPTDGVNFLEDGVAVDNLVQQIRNKLHLNPLPLFDTR